MPSTVVVKDVTTLIDAAAGEDDSVIAAEDKRGRPGVFVPAQLLLSGGEVGSDVEARLVELLRNVVAHRGATTDLRAGLATLATERVDVPVPLLDVLIVDTENQLRVLRAIRAKGAEPERVSLESPAGSVEYTLPLSADDTYGSTEVSKILSPTGKGHRTIAQHRRESNELLGIKIGGRYRYPKFQIDADRREIRRAVAHANQALESDEDPWGTLAWWFSPEIAFDRRRPVDMVASGELTEELVDLAMDVGSASME